MQDGMRIVHAYGMNSVSLTDTGHDLIASVGGGGGGYALSAGVGRRVAGLVDDLLVAQMPTTIASTAVTDGASKTAQRGGCALQ